MLSAVLALFLFSCFSAAAQPVPRLSAQIAVSARTAALDLPQAPDYADTAEFWYMPGYNAGLRKAADIIYIYPTTGTEPYDAEGELADYSDPRDSIERAPATLDMRVKRELFTGR